MIGNSLPKGWRLVKFGDLVRKVNNRIEPESSGISRYVAGEHMDSDNLNITRWGIVGDGYLGPAFTMRFQPGQVLYGSRRTYLRKVAVADFEGICANTTFVLETKSDDLLQEFLPHVMSTERFHTHSISKSKGSVNPYINFVDLNDYEFVLPPIAEQHRIIKLMSAIDDALTSNASVDIDPLLESLYWSDHQLDDECVKLGEVVAQGGGSIRELPSESTIDYIDLSCVSREFGIEHQEIKKYLVSEAPSRAQKIVQTNDLLIATVRPNLRATARVAEQENGWVASTGFAVLRPRDEVEASFLHGLIRTNAFTNYLVEKATGSNYPAVRPREIENFLIPVSKWKRRTEIARSVDLLMRINRDLASNLMSLRNVRRATLESLIEVGVNV